MNKNMVFEPLATRMRPRSLQEFVGQSHLLAQGKPLRLALEKGILHSMIFWGPPGTGKTTLAELMSLQSNAHFKKISAVMSGVKEIRAIVEEAKKTQHATGKKTILFIDEIHRFNKSQQDIFLPYIEDGTFIIIGATTENPSFELNSALLSRARVYVLKSLTEQELFIILQTALANTERGLGKFKIDFPLALQKILINAADGDARQTLNLLEMIGDLATENLIVTECLLSEVIQLKLRRFDKQGELFYDQISALHKAVRGSSPDAALYWLCCMLEGGADPSYLGRRIIRMASEDIGLADPRALTIALEANDVYERLGSPEGELAFAHAVVYLSCAAKSNAVYVAFNKAMHDAKHYGTLDVPLHLRNAPTTLMKNLDYGKDYRYAHHEEYSYAANENYFPVELKGTEYYFPTNNGMEIKIAEKLAFLKSLDKKAKK